MKSTHAICLCVTLAVALAVASAVAQRPNGGDFQSADHGQTPNPRPFAEPDSINLRYQTDTYYGQTGAEAKYTSNVNALVQQLEAAKSDNDREAVKTKLSDLLGKQFDARQTRHKHEIETLETQVKKLKELVQRRQENRAEIISRRIDQIVRESQGLGF